MWSFWMKSIATVERQNSKQILKTNSRIESTNSWSKNNEMKILAIYSIVSIIVNNNIKQILK